MGYAKFIAWYASAVNFINNGFKLFSQLQWWNLMHGEFGLGKSLLVGQTWWAEDIFCSYHFAQKQNDKMSRLTIGLSGEVKKAFA